MTNNPKIRIYKHRSYKVLRAWQSYCPCCNATEIAGTFSDIVRRTEYHVIAHQLADKLNKLPASWQKLPRGCLA